MILAEHFPQNDPLHFQANNIPGYNMVTEDITCNNIKYQGDPINNANTSLLSPLLFFKIVYHQENMSVKCIPP